MIDTVISLCQWFQHKRSFEHQLVRNLKSIMLYSSIVVQQDVKIYRPRTFVHQLDSVECLFDSL